MHTKSLLNCGLLWCFIDVIEDPSRMNIYLFRRAALELGANFRSPRICLSSSIFFFLLLAFLIGSLCLYYVCIMPLCLVMILAASSEKESPSSMRKMHGFTSFRTCAKSHPSICSPLKQSIVSKDFAFEQKMPRSECGEVQADLDRRCPHAQTQIQHTVERAVKPHTICATP